MRVFEDFEILPDGAVVASGSLRGFGLVFLFGGLFFMVAPFQVDGGAADRDELLVTVFSVPLTAFGAWLAFLRQELRIAAGLIRWTRWTILGRRIDEAPSIVLEAVRFSCEQDHGSVHYLVGLLIDHPRFPSWLQIACGQDEEPTRSRAGELAQTLGLPLR